MTSIKPPTAPTSTLPQALGEASGTSPAGDVGRTDALGGPDGAAGGLTGVSHSRANTNVQGASVPSAEVSPAGVSGPVDLAALARAVERGQLSMSQAIDRLVQAAIGSVPGQLTELERAELTEILALAVQSDPTLGALRDER